MLIQDQSIKNKIKSHHTYKQTEYTLIEFKKRVWTTSFINSLSVLSKATFIIRPGKIQ